MMPPRLRLLDSVWPRVGDEVDARTITWHDVLSKKSSGATRSDLEMAGRAVVRITRKGMPRRRSRAAP